MIVYIAIDDNSGMMFNSRRQSQDKLLRLDMLMDTKDSILWMNNYSAEQFSNDFQDGIPGNIKVDNDFIEKADDKDSCFVENLSLSKYKNKIRTLVIYKWNRDYPADFYFDIDLKDWKLISSTDFTGNSHENITKEVWTR